MNRVFISKYDLYSVYGMGREPFLSSLVTGQSGVQSSAVFGYERDFPVKAIGLLPNFNESYPSSEGRLSHTLSELGRTRVFQGTQVDGVIVGKGSRDFSLGLLLKAANDPTGKLETTDLPVVETFLGDLGVKYPKSRIFFTSNTCATTLVSLGMAYDRIRHGIWNRALVLSYDLVGFRNQILSLHSVRALSTRYCSPEVASCPFSLERDGMVKSEGVNIFLLESEAAMAKSRVGLAEIRGWACTNDAYLPTDMKPDLNPIVNCMKGAIKSAGLAPRDIDHINAHGSSTRQNDLQETLAIKRVLGESAKKIHVTALKSRIGHATFASGGFSVIGSMLMFEKNLIFSNTLQTPDPECDLLCSSILVENHRIKYSLINAFGFGGHNACMVLNNS